MSARAIIKAVEGHSETKTRSVLRPGVTWPRVGVVWCAVMAALVFALVWTVPALAAYEQQPEHFGASGEAQQVAGADALAVNTSGAGGVQAGSLYVVGSNDRVARFAAGAEGEEPRFEEAWGWGVAEGGPYPYEYERCGPAYHNKANPAEHTYEHCTPANGIARFGGEEPGHFETPVGVAVDQLTGDVYVRNVNGRGWPREHHLIEVLTAKGELVGEGFGDAGNISSSPPESIVEGPEKLHLTQGYAITVDSSGTVYLLDADYGGVEHRQTRVMSFEPCDAGFYENYCYAAGKDVPVQVPNASDIALVGGDRVVVASEELVSEYPLGVEHATPICSLPVSGQLSGMTANELTGEVFYATRHDHKIHRLAPCDEATGAFQELQNMKIQPASEQVFALAVNPGLAWGLLRPPGVLYAVDYEHEIGDIFAPAEVSPPEVQSESVANTTTVSTMMEAQIDPLGEATKYTFQYLTLAQYEGGGFASGASEAPASPGEIPSGQVATVTTGVEGLAPDTQYVFRVLASSLCNPENPKEVCKANGVPAFFATYSEAPTGLPDGRAYELVSPPDKNGGEVFPADPSVSSCIIECKPPGQAAISKVYPMQGAPDGDAVAYMGQPFSSTEGSSAFDSYISRRTTSGWQTTAMSPALLSTRHGEDSAYSTQLTEGVVDQASPQLSPQAPAGYGNLYLQSATDPSSLTPLVTTKPPDREPLAFAIEYGGYSPDFSAQFFAANDALIHDVPGIGVLPDPGSTGRDLYESREGQLALVNVLPNATVATGARFASASPNAHASASPDAHAIAANGRRVFWEANGHLYVREDGRVTREITQPGTFLTASEDGLTVLLSDGCLYSLSSETCTDLTQGKGGFQGIAGNNGDLSQIYFVDKAALTPEATAGTCTKAEQSDTQAKAEEREGKVPPGLGCNLYVYQAGVGSTLIATLLPTDDAGEDLQPADWAAEPTARTAEASPDGQYLAFVSTARLTGYDNTGPCELVTNAQNNFELVSAPCAEVFLYDTVTKRLACASCNPTGEAPRGFSTLRRIDSERAWEAQPRYLTDKGRLFFDSQDRLSPKDTNGKVEDVYEDEPAGVGSCRRAAGCLLLISSGAGASDSNFLAMDESGANVFFTTRERLLPAKDTDELIDLYDAREGGGFPGETEAINSECQGEACQSTPVPPVFATPGSTTFSGLGTVFPATTTTFSSTPKPTVKRHAATRTQRLSRALRACRDKHVKRKRVACEKRVRRRARGAGKIARRVHGKSGARGVRR